MVLSVAGARPPHAQPRGVEGAEGPDDTEGCAPPLFWDEVIFLITGTGINTSRRRREHGPKGRGPKAREPMVRATLYGASPYKIYIFCEAEDVDLAWFTLLRGA